MVSNYILTRQTTAADPYHQQSFIRLSDKTTFTTTIGQHGPAQKFTLVYAGRLASESDRGFNSDVPLDLYL